MIGLDTNVLVRYLAQDDVIQSHRAMQVIERTLTDEHPGSSALSLCSKLLDRVYGLSNQEIANAVERILRADRLVVQNAQEAFTAMTALKSGAGSFSDALITALGAWAGCTATLTFDKSAKRLHFQLL